MAGGSSRLEWVSTLIEEVFKKKPLNDIVSDEVIAEGAALRAAQLSGELGAARKLVDKIFESNIGIVLGDFKFKDDKKTKDVVWVVTHG